jgi:hypothetical protein
MCGILRILILFGRQADRAFGTDALRWGFLFVILLGPFTTHVRFTFFIVLCWVMWNCCVAAHTLPIHSREFPKGRGNIFTVCGYLDFESGGTNWYFENKQ